MTRLRAAIAILCGVGALGAPALADDINPDFAARQTMTLARIRPSGRANFYHDGEVDGCPAMTAKCRRRAYLVGGDVLLVGARHGDLIDAVFTSPEGRSTEGWLPVGAIEPIPTPAVKLSSWLGSWGDGDAEIDISAGSQPGRLKASGTATYGHGNAIHDGGFEAEAVMEGDRVTFNDDDCRVSVRIIGPYLVAADNLDCGGVNVTFSGTYRRMPR
jgi:hypothetical protein